MSATAATVKGAAVLLSDERGRKVVGGVLVAILSPIILLVALLCSLGSGTAEHNNRMTDYLFLGSSYDGEIPAEFEEQVTNMQASFSSLDSEVASVNELAESSGLDPVQVKAIYYVLCSEGQMGTNTFTDQFYALEERTRTTTVSTEDGDTVTIEETYTVAVPHSLTTVYANLSSSLGREITAEEKANIQELYNRVTGSSGEGYDGSYVRGNDPSVDLDISAFTNPGTKNAHDLVVYAKHAWNSGWGYVWGTYGQVLTESLLEYKLQQYPDGVGKYEDFIRAHWLNGRTTDCVGLIKGYGWLDEETLTIKYGTNGMPDVGANGMCSNAKEKGPISTMPDIPGLAVWMDGHIGVYIGNGEVIEASGTKKGVIKTQLANRGWTMWLKIPYISYN